MDDGEDRGGRKRPPKPQLRQTVGDAIDARLTMRKQGRVHRLAAMREVILDFEAASEVFPDDPRSAFRHILRSCWDLVLAIGREDLEELFRGITYELIKHDEGHGSPMLTPERRGPGSPTPPLDERIVLAIGAEYLDQLMLTKKYKKIEAATIISSIMKESHIFARLIEL